LTTRTAEGLGANASHSVLCTEHSRPAKPIAEVVVEGSASSLPPSALLFRQTPRLRSKAAWHVSRSPSAPLCSPKYLAPAFKGVVEQSLPSSISRSPLSRLDSGKPDATPPCAVKVEQQRRSSGEPVEHWIRGLSGILASGASRSRCSPGEGCNGPEGWVTRLFIEARQQLRPPFPSALHPSLPLSSPNPPRIAMPRRFRSRSTTSSTPTVASDKKDLEASRPGEVQLVTVEEGDEEIVQDDVFGKQGGKDTINYRQVGWKSMAAIMTSAFSSLFTLLRLVLTCFSALLTQFSFTESHIGPFPRFHPLLRLFTDPYHCLT
jgi:hypothetical protein